MPPKFTKFSFFIAFITAVIAIVTANGFIIPLLSEADPPPDGYKYELPQGNYSRSPCPALNTLANHGYINRNGLNIDRISLYHSLRKAFGLSNGFAFALAYGSSLLLPQFSYLSLSDYRRHNCIEHDCSLAHKDITGEQEYAANRVDTQLLQQLLDYSSDGRNMTIDDIVRAKVRRDNDCFVQRGNRTLDPVHAEIARGEVALVWEIFGGEEKSVPVDLLRDWWTYERLPQGWAPRKTQTLFGAAKASWDLHLRMEALRGRCCYNCTGSCSVAVVVGKVVHVTEYVLNSLRGFTKSV